MSCICDLKSHKKIKQGQNFAILKKLLIAEHPLERQSFEESKRKTVYHSEEYLMDKSLREEQRKQVGAIAHSTIIKRFGELASKYYVAEVRPRGKSKRNLPIRRYRITSLGVLELLRNSNPKSDQDLFDSIRTVIPPILNWSIDFLLETFTKEQLFDTMISVANNLVVDFESKKEEIGILHARGSEIDRLRKAKWAHRFSLDSKIPLNNSLTLHIEKEFTVFGNKPKTEPMIKSEKIMTEVDLLFVFMFCFELLMRCTRSKEEFQNYPTIQGIWVISQMIKNNDILQTLFSNYLHILQNKNEQEMSVISDFENKFLKN